MNKTEGTETADDAGEIDLPSFFGDAEADPFDGAELEDEAASADADAEGSAEAETASESGSGTPPKTVPYKRLQKVVAERNAARERLAELEAVESKLRNELSGHEAFRSAVAQRYGRFRNPTAQLALDSDFMSAMEAMAKTDPEVGKFYKKVMDHMGVETPANQSQQQSASEPAKDTRLDRIVERHARATIGEVLQPLKLQDKYVKLITNHVLQNASDPADIDAAIVKKFARSWMAESGFSLEEMRQAKAAAADPKPKPPVGRQNAAAPGSRGGKAPAKADKAPDLKTREGREAWLRERESRLDEIIAELMPQ